MLESLYAGALADAEERQKNLPIKELEVLALATPKPQDAFDFLSRGSRVNVIAEIKRASPSRGLLAEIPDVASLAKIYESAGAAVISVLTEQRSFLGKLDDLSTVSAAVNVPTLRKDFIATEYQILEARAAGASMILLIVAGLEQKVLSSLKSFAESLGLQVLLETHTAEEIERAKLLTPRIVGINARNLSTFSTDRDLFGNLASLLPSDCIRVAESAVRGVEDVEAYAQAGADCVLVGEALVIGDAENLIRSFTQIPKV